MLCRLLKMWHLTWHANISSWHGLTNRSKLLPRLHELRRLLLMNHRPKLHRHRRSQILWWDTRAHHRGPRLLRWPRRLHITCHQSTSKCDAKKRKQVFPNTVARGRKSIQVRIRATSSRTEDDDDAVSTTGEDPPERSNPPSIRGGRSASAEGDLEGGAGSGGAGRGRQGTRPRRPPCEITVAARRRGARDQ